jgi:outer membrane receptor protein involved in Fe transport
MTDQSRLKNISELTRAGHGSGVSGVPEPKLSDGRHFCKRVLTHSVWAAFTGAMLSTPLSAQDSVRDEIIELEEFTVTAQKREEPQQEVPVAINALGGFDIRDLRVENLDDYMKYLPNVTIQGTGPGQNELYVRGAATSQTVISLSSVQAVQPSVALYVDEMPVSLQGRNLDVYVTDIERIEVLPGPQGTLFGASSQAGTIRLISRKPEYDEESAGMDVSISSTEGGDPSQALKAYFNLPISESFAVRVAAYNDRKGGWIDHILNDPENGGWNGSAVVVDRISGGPLPDPENMEMPIPRNDHLVEDNHNDATYSGARFSAAYKMSEDWDLLVQHTQQTLETEGVWAYDPNLEGDTSVNRFAPDENTDEFGLTTWTVNGRLGQLDLIYTGGYLNRDITSTIDYTFYTNGGLFSAYYVAYPGDGTYSELFDPSKFYKEDTNNTRITHEFRVSTPVENRIRAIGGIFLDEQKLASVGLFKIASTDSPYFQNLARMLANPNAEGVNSDGGPFSPEISFINDVTRRTTQVAGFGQVEFDLTDTVTAAFGARTYAIDDDYKGSTSTVDVTSRLQAMGAGDLASLQNFFGDAAGSATYDAIQSGQLDVSDLGSDGVLKAEDVIYRASIDWKVKEDVLLFATFAQGFRPPVTNRVGGGLANNQTGVFEGFRIPVYSQTDDLDNFEFGMKADFLENRLRVNLTGYKSEISNMQLSRYDPTNINFLWFVDNVGDAEITGLDGEIIWRASRALTLTSAFGFVDSEITRLNPEMDGIVVPVGSRLPYSPEFSASLRARYTFLLPSIGKLTGLLGHVRGGLVYKGDSMAGLKMDAYVIEDTMKRVYQVDGSGLKIDPVGEEFLGAAPGTELIGINGTPGGRYVQEGYTMLNIGIGVTGANWSAELFVDNLTDEAGIKYIDTQQYTPHVVAERPRTVGIRFSYDFM